jgi:DNA-3-methyladenine glycosylase
MREAEERRAKMHIAPTVGLTRGAFMAGIRAISFRRCYASGVKLSRDFYQRDTLDVAHDLIGAVLVRVGPGGAQYRARIVETEAYKGFEDRASHAFRGRTARTALMFGPPGYAYVYLIYGMYHCLNAVTESADFPAAVLIRAVEPLASITDKTAGPGLLCRAMEIDRALNGADLCGEILYIERRSDETASPRIGKSARIGVDYAGAWAKKPWRFFDKDSAHVSTARGSRARSRRTTRSIAR